MVVRLILLSAVAAAMPPAAAAPGMSEQLKNEHGKTEALKKVCGVAEEVRTQGRSGRGINELLKPATAVPGAPVISDFGDPAYERMRRELWR
jgi:hypothetical protein